MSPETARRRFRKAVRRGLDDMPAAAAVSDVECGVQSSKYSTPVEALETAAAAACAAPSGTRLRDPREFGRAFRRELAARIGGRSDGRATIAGVDYAYAH